jgi:HK97 family phage major capsid protein
MTSEELKTKWTGLHAQATALMGAADAEKRTLSSEEQGQYDSLLDQCEALSADIDRRERAAEIQARLDAPRRKVTPESPQSATQAPRPGNAASTQSPRYTGGGPADTKTFGFSSLGEFAMLAREARVSGNVDPRLRILNAATTFGSEGVGADGGYAVPPDFRTNIMKKVLGEDALLGMTDQLTTTSNEIVIPIDETTPWQTSGGVLAQWLGEGAALTGTKPALNATTVRTNKLAALVPVTDELLADASTLEGYLSGKVPDKINFAVNAAIIGGDGVGKPTGILTAASTVSQAAEGSQTAATVNYQNVTKMWSRMYAPSRRNGVWILNQDIEPQLFAMVVGGTTTAFPAYLPPGGLSSSPYGTLFGRPVVYSEACSAVGTVGDIIFADLSQYVSVVKAGGVRSDVSIHLYFDQDVTAFRFILRVGGQPYWKTSITRAKSALPLSWAVTLAAR